MPTMPEQPTFSGQFISRRAILGAVISSLYVTSLLYLPPGRWMIAVGAGLAVFFYLLSFEFGLWCQRMAGGLIGSGILLLFSPALKVIVQWDEDTSGALFIEKSDLPAGVLIVSGFLFGCIAYFWRTRILRATVSTPASTEIQTSGPNSPIVTGDNNIIQYHLDRDREGITDRPDTAQESSATPSTRIDLNALSEDVVSQILQKLDSAIGEGNTGATVDHQAVALVLDVPPLVRRLAKRQRTINEIMGRFAQVSWLAVHGDPGSGKSQLAALVCLQDQNCRLWVRFRGLSPEDSCERLLLAVSTVVSPSEHQSQSEMFNQVCTALGAQSLLVLDDLPRLGDEDVFSTVLVSFVQRCQANGVKLLSTSNHQLPSNMLHIFGDSVATMERPAFTDEEVMELMRAYNAPTEVVTEAFASFVNSLAQEHPLLLAAACDFLVKRGWKVNNNDLEQLLRGDHTSTLGLEISSKLANSVQDSSTRQLLYRVCNIVGDFSEEDLEAVAQVEPTIDRYRELLLALEGVWILRDSQNRLVRSPLASVLPVSILSVDERRAVQLVLGSRIVRKLTLSSADARLAILYFAGAEQFNYAGSLLANALESIRCLARPVGDTGLLSMWGNTDLPESMDLGLRIFLRGLQVVTRRSHELDYAYALEDLKILSSKADKGEAWAAIGVVAIALEVVLDSDFETALSLVRVGISSGTTVPGPRGGVVDLSSDIPSEELLWMTFWGTSSAEDLTNWIQLVDGLDDDQRDRLFSIDEYDQLVLFMPARIWLLEVEKPEDQRDWQAVLARLNNLAEVAARWNQPVLRAAIQRAEIIVTYDYLRSLEGAIGIAKKELELSPEDDRIKFLLHESVGRQCFYAKRYKEAETWLGTAVKIELNVFHLQRVEAVAAYSAAIGNRDSDEALTHAESAAELALSAGDISELAQVQALGELAVARWETEDIKGAFRSLDDAGKLLLAAKEDTPTWQGLFMWYGHVCGYMAAVMYEGKPPDATMDGGAYTKPWRGSFFTDHEAKSAIYKEEHESGIYLNLIRFADAIENDISADHWAHQAQEGSEEDGHSVLRGFYKSMRVANLLENNEFGRALDHEFEAASITTAMEIVHSQQGTKRWQPVDVDEVLGEPSGERRVRAENAAAFMILLPIMFRLSTVHLENASLARQYALDVAGYCGDLRKEKLHSEVWDLFGDLLLDIFEKRISGQELVRKGNVFGEQDYWSLRGVAYLGVAVVEGTSLESVLQAHFAVVPYVRAVWESMIGVYRRIALPYLDKYWIGQFEEGRFRFYRPVEVESVLQAAVASPVNRRAQRVLSAIASGLRVDVPKEVQPWLKDEGAKE